MNNYTILIADDDFDYLYQMSYHIAKAGFNVIKANSQAEAEAIIENTKPSLALLDLMMENHDSGFILAYKIKKQYPNVPVILCTAVASETGIDFSTNTEGSWVKADKYLEKGSKPEYIIETIKLMLNI